MSINFYGQIAPFLLQPSRVHLRFEDLLFVEGPPEVAGGVPDQGYPLPHQELLGQSENAGNIIPI